MNELIDFHTHILPGVDDGSQSIRESLTMLELEASQGIHKVVLTPHFYPQSDTPEHFLARRKTASENLLDAMVTKTGLPEILSGAEVHYFRGISEFDMLSTLTIENTDFILIEMPPSPWKPYMLEELAEIHAKQNLTPIVAHIDRYIHPFTAHRITELLNDLPVLVQANASFFLRRTTSRTAFQLLKKRQIHLLGSDCHNLVTRPPNLALAWNTIQCHLGPDPISFICRCQKEVLNF